MNSFSIRHSASMTAAMVQLIDFSAICVGAWISYQIRFASGFNFVELQAAEKILVIGIAAFAALLFSKVYRMWPGGSLAAMVGRVTLGWVIAWTSLIVLLALSKSADQYSRVWLITWLGVATVSLCSGRVLSFLIMGKMRRAGYHHKKVLLCGDTEMLQSVKQRIESAAWSGYDVVGMLELGEIHALEATDRDLKPDEIWISLQLTNHLDLETIINSLRQSVANIRLLPNITTYQILNHGMSMTLGMPMVDLSVSPIFGSTKYIKTFLDYSVAGLVLVLLSPVLIAIAAAVKFSSKGPVLFHQKRHGWNNEIIWIYKFRSMKVHEELHGGVTQAQKYDPRVTPVGRFLRKTSLDELPQFINVLQGRMSVVGPRPHAIEHNNEYVNLIPKYALRHKVRPGITGWAQICGHRGETDTLDKMESRVKHDLYYLENWSIWLDLKIILMTPFSTIQNKNVY